MISVSIMKFFRINVYGRVHGVGFRYSALRAAKENKLCGTVRNTRDGVEIIVNEKDFLERLDLPSFARITDKTIEEIELEEFSDFKIIDSTY